jgi:hypothetical protein
LNILTRWDYCSPLRHICKEITRYNMLHSDIVKPESGSPKFEAGLEAPKLFTKLPCLCFLCSNTHCQTCAQSIVSGIRQLAIGTIKFFCSLGSSSTGLTALSVGPCFLPLHHYSRTQHHSARRSVATLTSFLAILRMYGLLNRRWLVLRERTAL